MTLISTRAATADDLDAVAALFDAYRQFYQQAPDLPLARAFVRERLQRSESVLIVGETGAKKIIGFLPALSDAVAAGVARMDLSTARTNTVAQSLYESLGWVRDDASSCLAMRAGARPE